MFVFRERLYAHPVELFFLFFSFLSCHWVCHMLVYNALQWFEISASRERIPHALPYSYRKKSIELCKFCIMWNIQERIPRIQCNGIVSVVWNTIWRSRSDLAQFLRWCCRFRRYVKMILNALHKNKSPYVISGDHSVGFHAHLIHYKLCNTLWPCT
jgi:hypothetical protein